MNSRPASGGRRQRELLRIYDFTDLIGSGARSARQSERALRAAGISLTPASFAALQQVCRHGPMRVTDVARRLRIDQSTASRQLRPLEAQGLIARRAEAGDRRAARLAPTARGRGVIERVRAATLRDFDAILGHWSAGDRRRLALLLERFRLDMLEAFADERGQVVGKRQSRTCTFLVRTNSSTPARPPSRP